MAKEREVNVIVDAKNKSKGAFLEIKKDLRQLGDEAKKGIGTFSNYIGKADKVVMSFADRMQFMDKIAKRTFQGTAAAAGIYMASTLRDFSQLNDGISRVNTLYDQTTESQRKMYQDSIRMFKMLPTNFNEITQGIYDTISAGADPKYATMYARKFGMAGVAGDADMDIVTKAAMGTMNAYKLEAKDLNRILDLQFMTVKDGITSYSELASSLGTGVLAGAQSAGITMEELYGSIAMITKNAIPANIATTSLIQLFNKFTDTKAIKEFKSFGVNIQDANYKTRPMIDILKDLNAQFEKKGMTSEQRKGYLKKLLGSDEAARAIMPLLSDLKEFQKILGDMNNSSGAMKDAFNDRLESMSTQFKLFWNQIKGMGLEQLLTLEPLLNAILGPWVKRTKLEFEIMGLEDAMELEENPTVKEMYVEQIALFKAQLDNIELAPVDKLKDALAESVKALDKINPPLAKFLDTIGNFALNFVGEEGAENREKAGNVGETVLRVYGAKKLVDVVNWFNKNFKLPNNDNKGTSTPENLVKTLQTMNVNSNIVNVYGKSINNAGTGTTPTVVGTPTKSSTSSTEAIPLPGKVVNIGTPKNLTTGIYTPEEYRVGGEKYKEFENRFQNAIENKETDKGNSNNVNLYSLRDDNGFDLSSLYPTSERSTDQTKEVVNLMNTKVMDELLKINQLQDKINNISMQNQVTVNPPNVKVYVNNKETPARTEIDYGRIEKHFDAQAKRYGRLV